MKRLILLSACGILCGCAEGPVQTAPETGVIQPESFIQPEPEITSELVAIAPQENTEKEAMPSEPAPTEYNALTAFEEYVILGKGTERAFVGEYTDLKDPGTYICRRCNAPLYKAEHKFSSRCGWPSFDDEIDGAVERTVDADGDRIEITCKACGGHLGHVFEGEGFTEKDTRHCVNSVSMKFVPEGEKLPPVVKRPKSEDGLNSETPEE